MLPVSLDCQFLGAHSVSLVLIMLQDTKDNAFSELYAFIIFV